MKLCTSVILILTFLKASSFHCNNARPILILFNAWNRCKSLFAIIKIIMQLSTNQSGEWHGKVGRCYFKMLSTALYLVTVASFQYKKRSLQVIYCYVVCTGSLSLQRNFQLQKSAKIRQSDFRKHSFKTLYTSRTCSKFGRDNKLRAQSLVVKAKSHL